MYWTTTNLDPISPAPLLEVLTRLTTYPKPAIYWVKLKSEYDMLPIGHCQVLSALCPFQAETAVIGSQKDLPCGSIGTVTTGREPVVDGFLANPHSMQNSSSAPSHLWSDPVDGSTSQTHATSNSTLPHELTGKCKDFTPKAYRGWTGHYQNNQWDLRKNMQLLVRTCHSAKADLGKWPPELRFWTWHWSESPAMVRSI